MKTEWGRVYPSELSLADAMLPKRRTGEVVAWSLALIPVLLWLMARPELNLGPGRRVGVQIGQVAGLAGIAMMSVSFVLSTRLRWMEPFFGGLDGMYRTHHRLGVSAFVLLLAHPIAHAIHFLPEDVHRALLFVLPVHGRWSVNAGVYAFWLLVLLLVVTLTTWLPYDKWKWSHKGLALVLLGGAVHMWFVESTRGRPVAMAELGGLRVFMNLIVGLGLVAATYRTIVHPWLPRAQYVVRRVQRLNEDVLEVEMAPVEQPIDAAPGQFVFVTFRANGLTRESHPYTLCGSPDVTTATVIVKAVGDYTTRLYERLEEGAEATLEGPYGQFDYRRGGDRQIWIAGGVGIAPFLSWARHLQGGKSFAPEVDVYYCVHDQNDAVHREELEALSQEIPGLRIELVCSVEEGHLHAGDLDRVDDADIFMCGPKRLTYDLHRQLRRRGVPAGRIHFEDFEFR